MISAQVFAPIDSKLVQPVPIGSHISKHTVPWRPRCYQAVVSSYLESNLADAWDLTQTGQGWSHRQEMSRGKNIPVCRRPKTGAKYRGSPRWKAVPVCGGLVTGTTETSKGSKHIDQYIHESRRNRAASQGGCFLWGELDDWWWAGLKRKSQWSSRLHKRKVWWRLILTQGTLRQAHSVPSRSRNTWLNSSNLSKYLNRLYKACFCFFFFGCVMDLWEQTGMGSIS